MESENLKLAFSLFEEMKNYQIRPNMVGDYSQSASIIYV